MPLLRRLARTAGGRVLAVVAVLALGWQAFVSVQVPMKIDDRLEEQPGRIDVVVTLNFPPERYHILVVQDYGRISRTTGHELVLRSTDLERIRELARFYWVRSIHPAEPAGTPPSTNTRSA